MPRAGRNRPARGYRITADHHHLADVEVVVPLEVVVLVVVLPLLQPIEATRPIATARVRNVFMGRSFLPFA